MDDLHIYIQTLLSARPTACFYTVKGEMWNNLSQSWQKMTVELQAAQS